MVNKDLLLDLVNGKTIIIEHALKLMQEGKQEKAIMHLKLAVQGIGNLSGYIEKEL